MGLTKRMAIRLFRKQWKRQPTTYTEKIQYFDEYLLYKILPEALNPWPHCWLCFYVYKNEVKETGEVPGITSKCKTCPIDWGKSNCEVKGTLYKQWLEASKKEELLYVVKCERLAWQISKLPEKKRRKK